MNIAVTLGTKTVIGNVTRYEFSVTRNPGAEPSHSAPSVEIREIRPVPRAQSPKHNAEEK